MFISSLFINGWRGEEEEEAGIYRRFYIRIRDAQAGFKQTHLDRIVKASLEPTVKTRYNETYDGIDARGKKINLRVTTTKRDSAS